MPISLTCPGCDTGFAVPDTLAGKWIKCKTCGTSVEVVAARAAVGRPASRPARAAVVADDDDDDFDAAPRSARAKPAAGGSKLPLVLAAVAGFVVVGGGAAAFLAFSGGPKPP